VAPPLYTIAPDRPFLATLAGGLAAQAGGDPLRLARMQVLLPTRRAVRALREAFLRTARADSAPGTPLLLPRMRAVGDIEADELDFEPESGADDTLSLPPAMPELRRRLLLAQLVRDWSAERGEALPPGQAAALAVALGRLLDTVASEGARLDGMAELVPGELALHWQTVLAFLEILPQRWPAVLAAEGAIDLADRRNRLLVRQAQEWRRLPPAGPIVAAGLTGGMPALAELIGVVLDLPQGAVILPGLDRSCDAEEWAAIAADEAHPQHVMARLLDGLGIAADEVGDWPDRPLPSARARRLDLVAQALRPAALTHRWRELPREAPAALAGLTRYECASPQDEAVTIALLLRRKLATPGATAALVTPDRELARRVAAELRRWHIAIDDSAGLPLNHTPPGTFLRLVVELADSGLAPVPLLAALKHPLAAGGLAPEAFRERTRRLELALRGPRPAPGLAGLRAVLGSDRDGLLPFVERLAAALGPFPHLLESPAVTLADIAIQHIAAAERLAASAEASGAERLWREPAGEAAARFCHELIEAARGLPEIPGRHYPALFEALAAGAVVRPAFGRHPRLAIWGLLEARLQQADLVILGGLNEGTWPGPAAYDPWMSRQMRRELGLAVPERAIGLAAHDFAQAIGAPEVALTRAARREGAPTVPSRWLLRLDTVLRAVGLADGLGPDPEIVGAATALDEPARYRPLPQAAPCPPLASRPRRLSVTQIETWLRDPYAIYARHILGLEALEALDADPGRAELGTLIHEALDAFVGRFPQALPERALADLLEIGRESFGPILSRPGVWAFWWPRFTRIAEWFVAEERLRRASLAESRSELSGSLTIAAPGGPFTVTGKADRIDRLAAGGLVLADYKTGALPAAKEIEAGLALQLPLEGAILRDGSFGNLSGAPEALEYWRLSGGEPAGERKPVGGADPGALVDRVLARVHALVARFDDPSTPYLPTPAPLWAPRFSDYGHLERLGDSEAEE
jgi:ATP-dependent helicase/nuclease subunit B